MLEIRFDGQRFGFWQQVSITRSVDDLCASVRLGVGLTGGISSLPLTANSVIEVFRDNNLVTTVRPDVRRRSVSAEQTGVSVEARSFGRELVDCQYSKTLSGLKLGEIVQQLCNTFNVPINVVADTAVVPNFSMQCESPSNALLNAARSANLLLYPTADGGLILTSPTNDAPVATLLYGENLQHYDLVDEYKLRFSEYTVKGYAYDDNSALVSSAADGGITFFRPMHIIADRAGQGLGACDRRALLERNRRLARAHRINLGVTGWSHSAGLWAINTQVRVIIPPEDIDDVFLIGDQEFSVDEKGGEVAHLQVMNRMAFDGEVVKQVKHGAGRKKK